MPTHVVTKMVRKGIPDIFRRYMWQTFRPITERKADPKWYEKTLEVLKTIQIRDVYLDLIQKDVDRLTPALVGYEVERERWEAKIVNVLKATAIRFPEIRYVQGMSMIVRICLAYMGEEVSAGTQF
ncbi:MAG: hypothetical protein P4M11_16060 [Candidatus Pacebacteria bacterium]|nr:hypothetical protein [Candidatus Paceibacterota bacterium]